MDLEYKGPHKVEKVSDMRYQCVYCKISWAYLNARDVAMLESTGRCLRREERLRKCKRYGNFLCAGIHEECQDDRDREV